MDMKERFNQLDTRAKWGIGIVGAVVVSPMIFAAAVSVISAAAAVAVAGVVGLAIIHGAPVVSMKFANWKIKGIVSEAQENPIETMVNLLANGKQAFETLRTNVTNAVAARDTFKTKAEQFAKKYPERAAEFTDKIFMMNARVEQKKQALNDAKRALEMGQDKLDEMTAYWQMSQALQAANKVVGLDNGDQFAKLKADTAVDAVFDSMNKAFAQMEVAASLEMDSVDKQEALGYNEPNVIQITPVTAKVTVK